MYRSKRFRVRPLQEVLEDIGSAAATFPEISRVFLADGDAMILSADKLTPILEAIRAAFLNLERVGIYSDARGINNKSDDELRRLKELGIEMVYLGLESGSNRVLEKVKKGVTAEEMTGAVVKAQKVGMKTSVIGLLGLGGKELSEEHGRETARVVSEMSPDYFSALTLTLVPGTEFADEVERGAVTPLTPEESLEELGRMVEWIEPKRPVVFRTNHASNYLALKGVLPDDRKQILKAIDSALKNKALRPEWMRGL